MDDMQLWQDIVDQIDFEPSVDATEINVIVHDGVVTLTGHAPTYRRKVTAVDIVESIRGVRSVKDEIEVRPTGTDSLPDTEIAQRVLQSLEWNTSVPDGTIHAFVQNGRVVLSGEVVWRYQAEAAVRAVQRLGGVTRIEDRIEVRPAVTETDVTDRIRKAFRRDADLEASSITVVVENGTVTLEGQVRFLGDRRCAERAAWAAPGVTNVVDRLTVR